MKTTICVGAGLVGLLCAARASQAQFGASSGQVVVSMDARYEVGSVPSVDDYSLTLPIPSSLPGTPMNFTVSTPEANASALIGVTIEPSRVQIFGQSSANAWCDAPLESCGSRSENGVTLSFALPHGGDYHIEVSDALVQTSLSARVVIRDGAGNEVLRIEDEFVANIGGALAPGAYTIEAGSIAVGEGEIPPHLGGYAAWSLVFAIAPAAPPCPGDADADEHVTFGDVTSVLANFGAVGAISAPGDADGTGVVNFSDITSVLASFGSACE